MFYVEKDSFLGLVGWDFAKPDGGNFRQETGVRIVERSATCEICQVQVSFVQVRSVALPCWPCFSWCTMSHMYIHSITYTLLLVGQYCKLKEWLTWELIVDFCNTCLRMFCTFPSWVGARERGDRRRRAQDMGTTNKKSMTTSSSVETTQNCQHLQLSCWLPQLQKWIHTVSFIWLFTFPFSTSS